MGIRDHLVCAGKGDEMDEECELWIQTDLSVNSALVPWGGSFPLGA